MKKERLKVGKSYHRLRTVVIDGVERRAECWIRCERITDNGAVFSRFFEREIALSNEQIREELGEE